MNEQLVGIIKDYLWTFPLTDTSEQDKKYKEELEKSETKFLYTGVLPSQDDFQERLNAVKSEDRLKYVLMDFGHVARKNWTPILVAATKGHLKLLDVMLESLAPSQLLQVLESSCMLHTLSSQGDYHSLEILVEYLSQKCEFEKVVDILLQKGDHGSILHYVMKCQPGKSDASSDRSRADIILLVTKALQSSTDHISKLLAIRDKNDNTILHLIFGTSFRTTQERLIPYIVKLKDIKPMWCQNQQGSTAFHLSMDSCHWYSISKLMSHSSFSQIKHLVSLLLYQDNKGCTILHKAVICNNKNAPQHFLQSLSYSQRLQVLSIRCNKGKTAIDYCTTSDDKEKGGGQGATNRTILLKYKTDALQELGTQASKQ